MLDLNKTALTDLQGTVSFGGGGGGGGGSDDGSHSPTTSTAEPNDPMRPFNDFSGAVQDGMVPIPPAPGGPTGGGGSGVQTHYEEQPFQH